MYASLDEWIAHEATPTSPDTSAEFDASVATLLSYRERLEALLGADAAWEDPGVVMDPGRSVGGSDPARALRVETEELISELTVRRPELAAATGHDDYAEALQYASIARQLLNYHAALARTTEDRVARGLGLRDAMMADNLAYIVERERARGRVLAFAHNSHLQRGRARWQLGPLLNVWWPAGAHVAEMLGPGYAAIGTSVRLSEAHGIPEPEPGTLESRLTRAGAGSVRLVPTQRARELPAPELARLPTAPTTPDIGIELDRDVLSRVRQLRPHKVVVLDCQCHTFADVEQALCRVIPAMTWPKAHAHAWEIHTSGASVVATAPQEQAEHFGIQLRRHGLRVTVESDG